MKQVSSTNKLFSSRELVILQKLYRSREFKNKRVINQVASTTVTFVVYGSINTLSSVQRMAFRTHISTCTDFRNLKVKLTLFSNTIAQYIMGFSSLQQIDNLIKGTTYQIVIIVSNRTEVDAYYQLFAFFTHLQSLKFTDEVFFNFNPSLVFTLSKNSDIIIPRRFHSRQTLISTNTQMTRFAINNIISTIESVFTKML